VPTGTYERMVLIREHELRNLEAVRRRVEKVVRDWCLPRT
jgi:hypothetical protein